MNFNGRECTFAYMEVLMKTYEKDLLEGYDQVGIIRSQDRKDSIAGMICIFSPSLLLLIFGVIYVKVTIVQWLTVLLLIPWIPVYIMLHELVHGAVYFILTGQSFKIGRDGNGFYCILPQIYVYFKTQLLCAAAPLICFTIIFLSGTVIAICRGSYLFIVLSGLLAFHYFACRSDAYLIKELYKIRNHRLLICEDEDGNNIVFGPQ